MSRCSRKLIPCLTYFCSRNTGGNRAGFVLGESDEAGLDCDDLPSQLRRVRRLEQGGELRSFLDSEDP